MMSNTLMSRIVEASAAASVPLPLKPHVSARLRACVPFSATSYFTNRRA